VCTKTASRHTAVDGCLGPVHCWRGCRPDTLR
jgi:hypothetical protein